MRVRMRDQNRVTVIGGGEKTVNFREKSEKKQT